MNLRPYQILGRDFLLSTPRAGLLIGMGGGKSLTTLAAIDARMLADVDRVLVISTLRIARSVWPEECAKWTPHLTAKFMGGSREEIVQNLKTSKAQIETINFEQLLFFVEQIQDVKPFRYQMIVVDESSKLQGYRITQGTKRAAAAMEIIFKARYCVLLTGLPTPNSLAQLWGPTFALDRGVSLGKSFEAFKGRWFMSAPGADGYQQIVALPHAQDEITERIRHLYLSIDLAQYMDLREPFLNDIYVDLPSDVMRRYKQMSKEFFTELAGQRVEAFNAAAKSQKLLQLANGAAIIDSTTGEWKHAHDAKIEALDDILEEASGAPVLVVYQYRSDLERILGRFLGVAKLLSSNQDIEDFQQGKIRAGVLHGKSGGHGLNLAQSCNTMAMFGLTWDLEIYAQVIERIGPARQASLGTNKLVTIHRILARNTIDTVVAQRLATKRSVQDCLMAAMRQHT